MSEKRFKLVDRNGIYRILDLHKKGKHILTGEENVDLLNALNDENEQLRQSIEHMISKATEISNRNVLLHEEIGRQTRLNKELQQKLDWICEQTGYDGAKFHHLEK